MLLMQLFSKYIKCITLKSHGGLIKCRAYHRPPSPGYRTIQGHVDRFCTLVGNSLSLGSSKGFLSRIEFRHDVYRYLFGNNFTLNLTDFNNTYFNDSWHQRFTLYKKRCSGTVVVFPIHVELYIAWIGSGHYLNSSQEFIKKKKRPVEMIKISLVKRNISRALNN